MAAEKSKSAKKKIAPGRLPSKRTINLVLEEKGKIKPLQAIPAVLAVLVLAALFGKFLVLDRLYSMYGAEGQVSRLRADLDAATTALENFDNVEDDYAHYTLDGMTAAELALVDRTQVLDLVVSIQPVLENVPTEADVARMMQALFREAPETGNPAIDKARQAKRQALLEQIIPLPEYVINSWSVTDNLLTIEITGQTLERMNLLAQEIRRSPIVNSCNISTANKNDRNANNNRREYNVSARFIVYLQKPPAPEATEAPAEEVAQP